MKKKKQTSVCSKMFQQHGRSSFITAEKLREVMCLNEKIYIPSPTVKSLYKLTFMTAVILLKIGLYFQTVKCLIQAKWEISTSAFIRHLKFYVYTYIPTGHSLMKFDAIISLIT